MSKEEVTESRTRQTLRTLLDSPPNSPPSHDSSTVYYSPLPPRRPFPLLPLQRSTLTLGSPQLHQRRLLHPLQRSLTLRSPQLIHRHSPSASEPLPLRLSLPHSPLPLRPGSEPPRPKPPALEMVIDMPHEEVKPARVCSWQIFYREARGLIQWLAGSVMSLCTVTTLGTMYVHQSDPKKAGTDKLINAITQVSNSSALWLMIACLIAYPTWHLVSLMFTGKRRRDLQVLVLFYGFILCGTLLYWVAGTWGMLLYWVAGVWSVPALLVGAVWLKRGPLWGRLRERCQQLFQLFG